MGFKAMNYFLKYCSAEGSLADNVPVIMGLGRVGCS